MLAAEPADLLVEADERRAFVEVRSQSLTSRPVHWGMRSSRFRWVSSEKIWDIGASGPLWSFTPPCPRVRALATSPWGADTLAAMVDTSPPDHRRGAAADRLRALPAEHAAQTARRPRGWRWPASWPAGRSCWNSPARTPPRCRTTGVFAVGDQLAVAGHDLAESCARLTPTAGLCARRSPCAAGARRRRRGRRSPERA